MTLLGIVQIVVFFAVLLLAVKPLGAYMARVYEGESLFGLEKVLGPVERLIYRLGGVRAGEEMGWKPYALALLAFNAIGVLAVYGLQRLQGGLPLNPQGLAGVAPDLAFNTAVSFATNTNWQSYSGESAMSYLTQMLGLTVQNFVSAATGMAVLVALVRGLARRQTAVIGNFWVDLTRGTLYVLLPLSVVLAVALVGQGVVQTFAPYRAVTLVQPYHKDDGTLVDTQTLALGPAASQVAIKQLGTNGGGFFGVNSAHPFENPTPTSNFLQCLAILLIPAALCHTFGRMVGDRRQGWAVLAAMTLVLVPLTFACYAAEAQANPALTVLGVDGADGNTEGKEARFGIAASAIWAAWTTAASNGSVNAMHDSFTPLGGLVPVWLMQLGEVVFGGVGSGLYGMLMFAIIAVFVSGLMVGRTPEYLGKKIEAFEMKMASLVILIPSALVLLGSAVAVGTGMGRGAIQDPGPHGFSEVLYWASSTGNNNGSAFAGLGTNNPLYNVAGAAMMFFSRYWLIVPVLAIAGSLAAKKRIPSGTGTLPTHTPLFVGLLIATVLLVGALTFIPALALGPIAEQLMR
ncbi:MAG TPA: potassium-transporting ATPase subunit KdpA [Tepidisphaeraceae bacterium]